MLLVLEKPKRKCNPKLRQPEWRQPPKPVTALTLFAKIAVGGMVTVVSAIAFAIE